MGTFVAETTVEACDTAILPGTIRLNVERLNPIFTKLSLDFAGDSLRAFVAADVLGNAIGHHHLSERG